MEKIKELLNLHNVMTKQAYQIMQEKNHDYTSGSHDPFANFRGSMILGISPIKGILIRIIDKIKRIQTYDEQGKLHVKNEGLQDAVLDIINYVILVYGLAQEQEQVKYKKGGM